MNFQGTEGKGITNKSGLFRSAVARKYSHVNIFFFPAASHSYIFLRSAPIVKDVLRLLFQFETQFAERDRSPASGYKSAPYVGEIEFPMNM